MLTLLSALGPWSGLCGLLSIGTAAWSLALALKGRAFQSALSAYASATTAAIAFWVVFELGPAPRTDLFEIGPWTNIEVAQLCLVGAWLTLGILLFVLARDPRAHPWTRERIAFWLCFTLLAALNLDVVRERFGFGDVGDYILAAEQLARGEPLHARYLYPPLLATLLVPLVSYGPKVVFLVCLGVNLLSLMGLFVLLRRALMRYGFADLAATLLSFLALCANVAVLRTLFYVQVNLHITNLMLLSLLTYPAHPLVSAFALALAAHIKTSPLVLALPFALGRDWKWLAWFALGVVGVVAFTSHMNGFQHYLEYYDNVSHVYRANGISLRDNSLDSLLRAGLRAFGKDLELARMPLLVMRASLFALAMWLCYGAIKHRTFSGGTGMSATLDARTALVMDSYPILMLLLTSISPLLWEHHPVLIVLSLLVLLKRLDCEADAALWLIAWFVIFLVPTFDVYPFSYRITLGAALSYWLMVRLVRRDGAPGTPRAAGRYFERADAFFRLAPRD
ncbi:MAG: hypothetical protein JWN48_5391 [Myxococcaceae bacterium]|nr:hypothetical protein [Myxococcaceae bacterium]